MEWLRRLRRTKHVTAQATLLGTSSLIAVATSAQAPSRWLFRHLPGPLKWLAGFEWSPSLVFGFGMIQLDEYLIADVCWIVSCAFVLAKITMWQRPTWLKLSASVMASMALGLLFFWTDVKRSEKAWFSLTAAKPSTSLYIERLPGLGSHSRRAIHYIYSRS